MAIDYDAEIEAITLAIASGATKVSYNGKSVEYGTRDDLLARLRWLQSNRPGSTTNHATAGFSSFSRGDC